MGSLALTSPTSLARKRLAVLNASRNCGLTSRRTTSKIPLTSNFSPPTKRWLGFRYRPHPCLRHGQVSLRSLVIRSDCQEYSTSGTDKTKILRQGGPERTKKKITILHLHYPSYVPNIIIMYYKIFGHYLDKIIRFYQ